VTIPFSSLIAPMPPGISTQNPTASTPANSWLATLLANASALGLPTTTWQPGDPLRTILAIQAVSDSKEDGVIALQAQGMFLDYAATGTVTLTDLDGTTATIAVSPDPSVPGQNPTGAPTWLDALASSQYDVKRIQATAAINAYCVVNTLGTSLGTFAAGTYHVANFVTGATYSNQAPFTLSPSPVIGTAIASMAGTSVVTLTTSTNHGLVTGAVVYLAAIPTIANLVGLVGSGVTTSSGFCTITVTGLATFNLNGVTGSGSYPLTAASLAYTPSTVVLGADAIGTTGNAGVGVINQLVTASPGCWGVNLVTFAGANWQSNVSLASTCRAKQATFSPNGPSGAYLFYALAAYLILSGNALPSSPPAVTAAVTAYLAVLGLPPLVNPLPAAFTLDGGPITRVVVATNPQSGTVTTIVANAGGPVGGCMTLPVTGATAASPIVITCVGHGCVTGDWVQAQGILGLTGGNGVFQCTRVDANHVSLNGSSGLGAYTAATGQLSGGDLYAVSAVLQAYATPNAVTQTVASATGVAVTVAATAYVPRAQVGAYTTAVNAVLLAYLTGFPIGGLTVDASTNVLPIGTIEGLIFAAGQQLPGQFYTLSVTGVTLNGVAADLALGPTGVVGPAITLTITVLPV
jgi:hypothetical protein